MILGLHLFHLKFSSPCTVSVSSTFFHMFVLAAQMSGDPRRVCSGPEAGASPLPGPLVDTLAGPFPCKNPRKQFSLLGEIVGFLRHGSFHLLLGAGQVLDAHLWNHLGKGIGALDIS